MKKLRFPNGIPRAAVPVDTLRDRIAAALMNERFVDHDCRECFDAALEEADAVIRELGLRKEYGIPNRAAIGAVMRRRPEPADYRHRYVTEWETDE